MKAGSVPSHAFGPYRLTDELGMGGMGVVYRARHEATGREVALKTVRVPKAGLLLGIRREIRALARLDHPGVARILDEGIEGGVPWYAMELVQGVTMRAWAAEQAPPGPAPSAAPDPPASPWWTMAAGAIAEAQAC